MDHKAFLRSLPATDKARLTRRADAPGLRHLALHGGLIAACALLIALRVPFWPLLIAPQGVLLAFLFTLQHETTHKTPFASEALNEWVGRITGVILFQPFLWFRHFHLAHHRHTNDPDHDPELAGLPKPDTWPDFLWHLSSVGYLRAKAEVLWRMAFGRIEADYLPARLHPRLRREARGLLAIYAVALALTVWVDPLLLWAWFVPLLVGFPVLRLYLLAEHGRCPTVASMFDNTRTTYTNRIVRFLAWNMPYHAEHHVYPQVPFHALPDFNRVIHDHLSQTSPGYRAFTRDYVAGFDGEPR